MGSRSSSSDRFDIFEVFRRYCDIRKRNSRSDGENGYRENDKSENSNSSREELRFLSQLVDESLCSRDSIFPEFPKVMSQLNLMGNFSEFSSFYEFVFFILREKGQKNLAVGRAITAWKILLAGRFRLLNQWCNFVEKYQRHNISEDTWCQVLAFSRCVHEDLEGYDPGGAWPVLIDDFVEHMYRITGSSHDQVCSRGDTEDQALNGEDYLPGLKSLPGSKRKPRNDYHKNDVEMACSLSSDDMNFVRDSKRTKQSSEVGRHEENLPRYLIDKSNAAAQANNSNNSQLPSFKSPCAFEGCLSKGIEGLFSSHACTRFDEDNKATYACCLFQSNSIFR